MLTFRLSQKLASKIKAGPLTSQPPGENPLVDWSAHLFLADRTQYILLSNTRSLYSTVLYGKGITDDAGFIKRALVDLRDALEEDGQAFVYHRFIAPESSRVGFARASDRTVTGCMNELIVQAKALLADDDLSPFDVGSRLNDVLLSALAAFGTGGYGTPRDAFRSMPGS